jgi:hypothetical protein
MQALMEFHLANGWARVTVIVIGEQPGNRGEVEP